jgi:3-oxoacyl-[acyl-carrier protein] reductase
MLKLCRRQSASLPDIGQEETVLLDGKVAIITGGATGIGAATARLLASHGAHVVITSELPEDAMQPVCAGIRAAGGSASVARCDIASNDEIIGLVGAVEREHGRLDILVQSAGVCFWGKLEEMPADRIQTMFAVNAIGPIMMIQQAIPVMRRNGGGAIVNISSGAAVIGVAQFAAYAATKAAMQHFTRTLAPELARSGIRVNAIGPGSVRTPMLGFTSENMTESQSASMEKRAAGSVSPYGNAIMEPEDIAQIVLFLVSDASRAVQGAFVLADQGFTAAMMPPG